MTLGAGGWPGASLCGNAPLSSLFTPKSAASGCSGDNSGLRALPDAHRHLRCSSSFPFPKMLPASCSLRDSARPTVVPLLHAEAQSQLARTNFCLASKGIIIAACSLRDWELFSFQLPSYSNWKFRDQYPPASSISNLSLPRFPFKFSGSTNLCPSGGFSLLLSCCCANQHSCSDGRYPSNGRTVFIFVCVYLCLHRHVHWERFACVRMKQGVQIGTRECSSRRVCLQVGVCKLCVCIYGADPVLEMWV